MISVIVDLIVAALLLATLVYCVMLNRRLAGLRDDKGELRQLIQGLTAASQRAEGAISGLRTSAEQVGGALQQDVDRARELREDLAYMLERGTVLADRLEGSIRAGRNEASAEPSRTGAAAERAPRAAEKMRLDPLGPAATPPEPERGAPAGGPAGGRVASFPSRVERDLRRVLEGNR